MKTSFKLFYLPIISLPVIFQIAYSLSLNFSYNNKLDTFIKQTLVFIEDTMPIGAMPIREKYTGVPYQVEKLISSFNEQTKNQHIPINIYSIGAIKSKLEYQVSNSVKYPIIIEQRSYETTLMISKISWEEHFKPYYLILLFVISLIYLFVFSKRKQKCEIEISSLSESTSNHEILNKDVEIVLENKQDTQISYDVIEKKAYPGTKDNELPSEPRVDSKTLSTYDEIKVEQDELVLVMNFIDKCIYYGNKKSEPISFKHFAFYSALLIYCEDFDNRNLLWNKYDNLSNQFIGLCESYYADLKQYHGINKQVPDFNSNVQATVSHIRKILKDLFKGDVLLEEKYIPPAPKGKGSRTTAHNYALTNIKGGDFEFKGEDKD
jgi:hypothetical protein